MGKLKPIGSEKLEGMDKIRRIMEIARYKENIPTRINEDSSVEYKKNFVDGNQYQIVKEKNGYVIKKQLNESNNFEYLEPMKNRRYYSSYSQALKRLNLVAKELNQLTGHKENVSMFTESDEATKYILKWKEGETNEQAPAPAAPAPAAPATPSPEGEVAAAPPVDDMPAEEPSPEAEPDTTEVPDTDEEPAEEAVTFKTIQKLTGKLAQKLRVLGSNEDQPMTSKDIKYVINSVLSALDLNLLEDEDKESIMAKFEGEEVEGEEGGMEGEPEEEPAPEEGGEEVATEPPAEPQPEMTEEMGFDSIEDRESAMDYIFSESEEDEDSKPKHKRKKHPELSDEENTALEEMVENIFSESNVDKVLKKYFKLDEREKKFLKEKKENIKKIKTLSENIVQEVSARKFLEKNPNSKVIGKSRTNNLVIEMNNKKFGISPKGQII